MKHLKKIMGTCINRPKQAGFRWHTWEKALAAGLLLAILFSFTGFAARCEDLSQRVLRLHVLANSDSEEDQALKLEVRDRILQESAGLLDGVQTKEEAETLVQQAMPQLLAAAQDEVARHGYSYPVTMELGPSFFGTRVYEDITLPAGTYQALRIKIGKAEGHNWWCVLFPSLCLPAAEENTEESEDSGQPAKTEESEETDGSSQKGSAAAADSSEKKPTDTASKTETSEKQESVGIEDVLPEDEVEVVKGQGASYEVRFKLLDWLECFSRWAWGEK